MNYPAFSKLCRSDLEALVSYVRGLAPSPTTRPSRARLPAQSAGAHHAQARSDRGRVSGREGHGGARRVSGEHGGLRRLPHTARGARPDCRARVCGRRQDAASHGWSAQSKNLTPDPSGIGGWSRETFINRFAAYRDEANLHQVEPNGFNTLMPWSMYAGMSDRDLGAIYDYLRTVETRAVRRRRDRCALSYAQRRRRPTFGLPTQLRSTWPSNASLTA